MANYAEIIDGVVNQVLVMDDNLSEQEAIAWLNANVSSNLWVKDSGDKNVYPGKGYEYNTEKDEFRAPKPFKDWVYDDKRGIYMPTIPKPIAVIVGYVWAYSQKLKRWVSVKILGN